MIPKLIGLDMNLKAQGHVTVNKPVISVIYIVTHTWPWCSAQILVDRVNPLKIYFQKSTNISAIIQHMSVSFVSLQSSRVYLQNSTVILRNTGCPRKIVPRLPEDCEKTAKDYH